MRKRKYAPSAGKLDPRVEISLSLAKFLQGTALSCRSSLVTAMERWKDRVVKNMRSLVHRAAAR